MPCQLHGHEVFSQDCSWAGWLSSVAFQARSAPACSSKDGPAMAEASRRVSEMSFIKGEVSMASRIIRSEERRVGKECSW